MVGGARVALFVPTDADEVPGRSSLAAGWKYDLKAFMVVVVGFLTKRITGCGSNHAVKVEKISLRQVRAALEIVQGS